MNLRRPATRPCTSCPYRRDVPPGIWDLAEYLLLPLFDQPTGEQPAGVFVCHQNPDRVCSGWAGCHDTAELLSLRLAARPSSASHLPLPELEATRDYTSPVPLFPDGRAAADHGIAGLDDPPPEARELVAKLLRLPGKRLGPAR